MIELIFAIVVISIAVISLPLLIQTSSDGMKGNLLQEAIFAGSAQLNEATTYTWDERSTNDLNISELARIVGTNTSGCPRAGIINRKCLTNTATRPLDTSVVNGSSIDSFAYTNQNIFLGGTSANAYKTDYNASLAVVRCSTGGCVKFGDETNNPNLKQLEYTVMHPDDGVVVRLRAYSANIGELKPSGRSL
jgi:hypothetical protein